MGEVHSFHRKTPPKRADDGTPEPAVIELLEKLLADAKRGNIQAIAIAGVRVGGLTTQAWEQGDGPNRHPLMASISYLQASFAASALESSFDRDDG